MSRNLTLGCCGRARHGKGTLATAMQCWHDVHRVPCQVISLADPLKDWLTQIVGRSEPFRGTDEQRNSPIGEFGWPDMSPAMRERAVAYWTQDVLHQNPSGRQLLQLFGTDVIRRGFLADAWVRIARNRSNQFAGTTIVDDVRFMNEAALKGHGGIFDYVFKVIRPGIPLLNHPSENAVDEIPTDWFSHVWINDRGMDHLAAHAHSWLDEVVAPTIPKVAA